MKTVILTRIASGLKGTFGAMAMDSIPLCVTCEDPWNNNAKGQSCIPEGSYICKKHNGLKYQDVWEVTGVPNRSAILIHNGNTIDNTEGCILVGKSFATLGGKPSISDSRVALDQLRRILPEEFRLEVR